MSARHGVAEKTDAEIRFSSVATIEERNWRISMDAVEWKRINGVVADAMKEYTRPFVTPLSTSDEDDVRSVGTGTYVEMEGGHILLTCEHVSRVQPMEYRFYGCDSVFRHPGPFTAAAEPIDVAFAALTEAAWGACEHRAGYVPYTQFAPMHRVSERAELLFFRGFAGENARYGFGVHEANATGYCSQEPAADKTDPMIFEMFWEPEKIEFSPGTQAAAREGMAHNVPGGLSGSLVWNTGYLEVTSAGSTWTPHDAVVTGILKRYDDKTKTLLALRVEHLRAWLDTTSSSSTKVDSRS
jgi:hypothetical protein